MSGKGDTPRPFSVPEHVFSNNWDSIFGKKDSDVSFADVPDENVALSSFKASLIEGADRKYMHGPVKVFEHGQAFETYKGIAIQADSPDRKANLIDLGDGTFAVTSD